MSTKLRYPQRQRCYACRRFFAWEVLDGLYCSRKCASLPPELPLDKAPRMCVTGGPSAPWRDWKKRYNTAEQANKDCTPKQNIYQCDYCHMWHVGTKRQSWSKELQTEEEYIQGTVL